jgi:hypothetical protein
MIKIEIANEQPKPERTVRFDFRRHAGATRHGALSLQQQAFLVADRQGYGPDLYPIKIDVRRQQFEELGFTVRVV